MSRGSSAARRIEENAPVSTCCRILKLARRAGETSLRLAKTIAFHNAHAVDELTRRHSSSRFRLDLSDAHPRSLTTSDEKLVAESGDNLAVRRVQLWPLRHQVSSPDRQTF